MKRALPALAVFLSVIAMAELPTAAYYELQQKATEVFYVTVRKVDVSKNPPSSERIRWTFRVDKVVRSKSGVKVGREIVVSTTQPTPDVMVAGPARAPRLKPGAKTIVFLNRSGNTFSLAKYGRSFEVTPKPREPRQRSGEASKAARP